MKSFQPQFAIYLDDLLKNLGLLNYYIMVYPDELVFIDGFLA